MSIKNVYIRLIYKSIIYKNTTKNFLYKSIFIKMCFKYNKNFYIGGIFHKIIIFIKNAFKIKKKFLYRVNFL